MAASPSFPWGSSTEPPRKARLSAIKGIECSSTSQASIPPGEVTRWTLELSDGQRRTRSPKEAPTAKPRKAHLFHILIIAPASLTTRAEATG